MKLYLTPGACSLADHIALHEAGVEFEREAVDLKAKKTASGADFTRVNPKGYVPALVLDDGEVLTENIAILDWIAHQKPELVPTGPLGRTRMLEALAFISTEIHKGFKPFFANGSEEAKAMATQALRNRLDQIAGTMQGHYLFGESLTVPDCYLFVMLTWARKFGIPLPEKLEHFRERMMGREAVRLAFKHEGLS
jgi:glutathione S-transferase